MGETCNAYLSKGTLRLECVRAAGHYTDDNNELHESGNWYWGDRSYGAFPATNGQVFAEHPDFPGVDDPVNHPTHYTTHPSGIECIQITEHMNFCLGNALKYIWRAGLKEGDGLEDLRKAEWYIRREIDRRQKEAVK